MKTHEFHYYVDAEKEELYLNDQAKRGRALTGYCLCCYTYEGCAPGEYIYRIDLLDGSPGQQQEYLEFLQESGIEFVARWQNWVYLRRRTSEGPFDLYSDNASKVRHLQKLMEFYTLLLFLVGFPTLFNLAIFFSTGSVINLFCTLLTLAIFVLILSVRKRVQSRLHALRAENQVRE